ncbi:MAG: InlB B-repeat-containing protein, partial [bacterium]
IETIVNATFTVTFDPNYAGSPTPMVVTVRKGETVNVPVQPTRPGHTFSDWYPGEFGGVAYDFNTPVVENMTLYALWRSVATVETPKEKTYTVTFETDGGSAVAPQTVKEGKKANIPDDPEKEGF